MHKAVKMSMIGIGIVAALVIAAVIVFVSTFDLNDYKGRISQAVEEETGRTLLFGGDLTLTIFPALGVELGPLSLSNAHGFGEAPMVQANSGHVSVKLLPLLKGDIKFGHLQLDQLSLRLNRTKDGTTNWSDLVGQVEKEEEQPQVADDSDFSLEIEGITIKDATLKWDDQMYETQFILSGVNLETGQIFEGAPFPVKASLNYECTHPRAKGAISLTGTSAIDFRTRVYSHMDTKISISAEGDAIPGSKAQTNLAWKLLVLDFKKEHAQITGLTGSMYDATVHLDGTFEGLTNGLKKASGALVVDPFDMRRTAVDMGAQPLNTGDPDALKKVAGALDFTFVPGQITVKSLTAKIDDTTLTAKGRIKRGEDDPFYFARIAIDTLNLDRYLPPEHRQKAKATKAAVKSGEKDDIILRSELLRRLHLDTETTIKNLTIEGAKFQNVKAEFKARHGLVRISPVTADGYGGTIALGATINGVRKYPKTDIIVGVEKLDVGALSQDMHDDKSYGGIANLNSALSCEGESVKAMLRSMNGKISFNLKDGIFPGVDLMRMAKTTHKQSKNKDGKIEADDSDSTKFGSIAGTGIITNGVLRNRDLEVKAPGYRAHGEGAIVLPTRQVDYLVKVKLTPTADGQDGRSSDELFGVMVPIRVSGTLDDPHYWVSISEYFKALGGAVIGTAGTVLGGVTKVLKGVGNAITGHSGEPEKPEEDKPKRKRFLGIF